MTKVLLAEDDLFLRDVYVDIFESEGFKITPAVDGEEALQEIEKGGWDVALLDVFMPKMNGDAILRSIKNRNPKKLAKHILFLTNTDEKKGLEDVMSMVEGVLLKSSLTPGDLVEKVKEILKK